MSDAGQNLRAALDALERYGEHDGECTATIRAQSKPCVCGLDATIEKLRTARKSAPPAPSGESRTVRGERGGLARAIVDGVLGASIAFIKTVDEPAFVQAVERAVGMILADRAPVESGTVSGERLTSAEWLARHPNASAFESEGLGGPIMRKPKPAPPLSPATPSVTVEELAELLCDERGAASEAPFVPYRALERQIQREWQVVARKVLSLPRALGRAETKSPGNATGSADSADSTSTGGAG